MTMERSAPPLGRPAPEDFEATYVANGFDECEVIYRASPTTIKRWLAEHGMERLRGLRREFVARQRAARKAISRMPKKAPTPVVRDGIVVPAEIVLAAANFLRTMRNGGWFCVATGRGDWWLGTMRKTPAQIVEFAAARGFDLEAANLTLKLAKG